MIPTPLTPIAEALAALYGVASAFNEFIDRQIDAMKESGKEVVRTCGRVLEGAKFGFGLGYIAPIIILATGQLLLGNPLGAAATVATGATLSNQIAMTSAAIGAIYFGWDALNDDEKQGILDRLSEDLKAGIEFVRAVIRYVIDFMTQAMTSDSIEEIKEIISKAASEFGKTLGDITRAIKDKVVDAAEYVADKVSDATDFLKKKPGRENGSKRHET